MENLFRGRGCNSHPVLGFFRYPQDCVLKQVPQGGAALLFFQSKIKVYLCTSEQSKLEKHSYGSKKFWKKQVYKSNYKIPLFCHSEKIGCLCKSGRKGHNLQRAISKPLPWRGGGDKNWKGWLLWHRGLLSGWRVEVVGLERGDGRLQLGVDERGRVDQTSLQVLGPDSTNRQPCQPNEERSSDQKCSL